MSIHPFFARQADQNTYTTDDVATSQSGAEREEVATEMEDDDMLPMPPKDMMLPPYRPKPGPKRQMRLFCGKISDQNPGSEASMLLESVVLSSDGPEPEEQSEQGRKRRRTTKKPRSVYPVEPVNAEQLDSFLKLKPKIKNQDGLSTPSTRRGSTARKSLIAVVNYVQAGRYSSLVGGKIDAILAGSYVHRFVTAPPAVQSAQSNHNKQNNQSTQSNQSGPKKPTHPFFSSAHKRNGSTASTLPSDTSTSAPLNGASSTNVPPPRPRKPTITPVRPISRPSELTSSIPLSISRDSRILRHSGMKEAPFPGRDQCHVKPASEEKNSLSSQYTSPYRKMQRRTCAVRREKNVDGKSFLMDWFVGSGIHNVHPFQLRSQARELLRLPTRYIISGQEVQRFMSPFIVHTSSLFGSVPGVPSFEHLGALYRSLETNLSAYDQETCESQQWTKKYSPNSSKQILQPAAEVKVLKSWLKTMTVQSVDSSIPSAKGSKKAAREAEKPKKKKRKAEDEFDDFLASEDDDETYMDDLSDPETDPLGWGSMLEQRSRVRRVPRSLRKKAHLLTRNCILISGPHGCGKTAAVYAVAKELGFEVFEINSGTRRSGRDILDRIGNMVENHLVQRVSKTLRTGQTGGDDDEKLEPTRSSTAAAMSNFFGSRSATENVSFTNADTNINLPTPSQSFSETKQPEGSSHSQQQSLILFEEVDVLFEEDKQFWDTVRSLALYSKRPIVMTCSDESAVPIDTLDLHAILQFRPPPVDLAADYLLLVSALEGHLLDRLAVVALYESKGCDLRAAITELDFWCQMGVGDCLGGLEWLFQRWPPGADVDSLGRKQRVISQNTYHSGMSWTSNDLLQWWDSGSSSGEEAVLFDVWHHLMPSVHELSTCLARRTTKNSFTNHDRLSLTRQMALSSQHDSDTDLLAQHGLFGDHVHQLDHSLDNASKTAKANHPLGTEYLDVEPIVYHSNIGSEMTLYSSLARRRSVPSPLDQCSYTPPNPSYSSTLSNVLLNHQCNRSRSILGHSPSASATQPPDFEAFDCLNEPISASSSGGNGRITISSLERELPVITLDIAPFVRSIVRSEQLRRQMKSAIFLTSIPQSVQPNWQASLSGGGHSPSSSQMDPSAYGATFVQDYPTPPNIISDTASLSILPTQGNRPRMSRVSRSAMDGVSRHAMRRENWFPRELSFSAVLATGGASWGNLASAMQGPPVFPYQAPPVQITSAAQY